MLSPPINAVSEEGTLTASRLGRARPDTQRVLWFLSGQIAEADTVRNVPVHSSPFAVGRRQDQHLCLPVATVSGRHAKIEEMNERLVLTDLKSTNGTFVNGRRIDAAVELQENDLVQFADQAFRIRQQSSHFDARTQCEQLCDRALSLVQFDKLMSDRAVTPHYQPIIDMRDSRVVGYEVLARSQIYGLEMPYAMFQAAAQLNLAVELSRMFRWEGVRCVASQTQPPLLFLNTHPNELSEPGLVESLEAIRQVSPKQPLVLEVHEAAITNARSMRELRGHLKRLDILLAYDDFGAGQNRLLELTEVPPDYLKFDMALIRDIDQSTQRQQILRALITIAQDLNIVSLAEGIETVAEGQACVDLGFTLAQGFLYGKPLPPQA